MTSRLPEPWLRGPLPGIHGLLQPPAHAFVMAREDVREPRAVGRGKLPSMVLGLIVHAAEHAQRHAGQIITTATIVRAGWSP